MATLNDEIKADIVMLLAQFYGYTEIAKIISAEHEVSIDRFQVRTYDPTKPTYGAGDRWRVLHERTRRAYLEDTESIPIARKAYRLNALQRIFNKAMEARNLVLANSTLEQAAKEAGGALTNQHIVKMQTRVEMMQPEERRAAMAELVSKALTFKDPLPSGSGRDAVQ